MPRLSLSTVYRSLRLFKRLGLVDEHHLGEEHHHYELKGAAEHYHLLCLGCGKVIEFQCPVAERLKEDVGREHGFKVTGVEVNLEGYCSECR
jgi:Fe2+ or Zn2+ uptake regulation protein